MPQGYRVEVAPNGRAICKNTECKKAGEKITKGDLRFGSLYEINGHTGWAYKHWGCVTPAQIQHLQEFSEGNLDLVDGYDELPHDVQKKVEYALDKGHVPDEDWRGDLEMNRPGKKGFRVPASKKKANEDNKEGEEDAKPKKKRGRPAKDENDEAPTPKKARGKKTAMKAEDGSGEGEVETKPKKTKGRKVAAKQEEEVADEEIKPKKGKAKKAAVKEPEPELKPKPKNPTRGKKAVAYKEESEDEDAEEQESEFEAPKSKRGRKKATQADEPKVAPQKKGRKKKATIDE